MKAAKGKGAARRDTKEALKPAEDRLDCLYFVLWKILTFFGEFV